MPREYKRYTLEDYDITKNGEIINKHTGKCLKGQKNGKGYLRVGIGKKLMFVHRLVATKYVPNPNNLPQVNHKDGNKLNNSADNLEWVSNQDNRNHALENGLHIMGERCPWAKLNQDQVDFIRKYDNIPSKEMAKIFSISYSHVREIRRNTTWRH